MSAVFDTKPRRKPVTYGKPARNRDQIFGYVNADSGPGNVSKTIPIRRQALSQLEQGDKGSRSTPPHRIKRPTETVRTTGEAAESLSSTHHEGLDRPSVFEVPSSDDDFESSGREISRKRRKLTPARGGPSASHEIAFSVEILNKNDDSFWEPWSQDLGRSRSEVPQSAEKGPRRVGRRKSRRLKSDMKRPGKSHQAASPPVFRHPTSPISETGSAFDKGPAVQMSMDSSAKSSPEPPVTPKSDRSARSSRFQDLLDQHGVRDTPSRLSMKGLRLSSDDESPSSPAEPWEFEQLAQRKEPSIRRTRTRLVDALSQPRHVTRTSPEAYSHDVMELDRNDEDLSKPQVVAEGVVEVAAKPFEQSISRDENIHTLAKGPKITYATQRSYLSDVVEDNSLESSLPSFSQSSDLGFPPRSGINNSFSQEIAQELQSDDDDDDGGFGAIRSIHELRKAGLNARFESNVESLFEDIESPGNSRRLTGLVQLCKRLIEHDFKCHFLDHHLDRRLTRSTSDPGVLGSALTVSAFLLLSCDQQLSLETSESCLKRSVELASLLLKEQRDILEIAKERNQNLSKAARNDLRDFRGGFIASQTWIDQRPVKLTPLIVCLSTIESMLRRTRELGDFGPSISLEVFTSVVDVLDTSLRPTADTDQVLALGKAVSILESYTVGIGKLDPEYMDALKKLTNPTKMIAALSSASATTVTSQTQELFLRLILNITNNNEELCDVFAQPSLISMIVDRAHYDFNDLLERKANLDEAEPGSYLNTVILSLGALINFAEWSSKVRLLILRLQTFNGEPYIEWLTTTFKTNVATFLEASSAAQSHAMVTFGYLAVLLTTLCLEDAVRTRVRRTLPGGNLRAVFVAVEEFLKHMRKVDEMDHDHGTGEIAQEGDGNERMSDFAERFQSIVKRLRRAERV